MDFYNKDMQSDVDAMNAIVANLSNHREFVELRQEVDELLSKNPTKPIDDIMKDVLYRDQQEYIYSESVPMDEVNPMYEYQAPSPNYAPLTPVSPPPQYHDHNYSPATDDISEKFQTIQFEDIQGQEDSNVTGAVGFSSHHSDISSSTHSTYQNSYKKYDSPLQTIKFEDLQGQEESDVNIAAGFSSHQSDLSSSTDLTCQNSDNHQHESLCLQLNPEETTVEFLPLNSPLSNLSSQDSYVSHSSPYSYNSPNYVDDSSFSCQNSPAMGVQTSTTSVRRKRNDSIKSPKTSLASPNKSRTKRMSLSNLSEDEKHDRIRDQNNRASREYRERKKNKDVFLQASIDDLTSENNQKQKQLQKLVRQLTLLEALVSEKRRQGLNVDEFMNVITRLKSQYRC